MEDESVRRTTIAEHLEFLIQAALNKKNTADDSERARKWAIVRTDLEKILGYVNAFLLEEE